MPNNEDFHLPIPSSPRPTTDQTMTPETTTRRPLFPATTAVWRFITRPIRWLWRRKLKITLWTATLITLGWQYENWHGRREYKEQLALFRAEYGDMKWSDFAPPRIPDEENFFAASVFETFVVPSQPIDTKMRQNGETDEEHAARIALMNRTRTLTDALPHARFLNLRIPSIKGSSPDSFPTLPEKEGVAFLDTTAWAKAESAGGKIRPQGGSDAQWLHASQPEDETVKGFIAALSRPKAGVLPAVADLTKIGDELENPYATPIHAVSGCFGCVRSLGLRARAAAQAGDLTAARQLCEVQWLIAEGYGSNPVLVGALVALAVEGEANAATTTALACRGWSEADLARLQRRLSAIDEEQTLFGAFYAESFRLHTWGGDLHRFLEENQRGFAPLSMKSGGKVAVWLYLHGPSGWMDTNLAAHLRWWRQLMVPRTAGDDLLAVHHKLEAGLGPVMTEVAKTGLPTVAGLMPSPRTIWAGILMPAFSNVFSNAIQSQTRRRQLLLAIAIERHLLAKGALPQQPADLVPAFIDAIPGDPWQPGTPLRWEVPDKDRDPAAPAIRYRILSAGKDTTLGFPEKLP